MTLFSMCYGKIRLCLYNDTKGVIIMEQHIQNAMNDNIITKAAAHYNVQFEDFKYVGGFENFIYEFEKAEQFYIVRFVHSTHRTFDEVFAELEFVDYLAHNNTNVSTIIHTDEDELLVKIDTENDEYFTVCAFTKAPGTFVKREDVNDEFLYNFGVAVGKLHALSKEFQPVHKRYHWFEEDYIGIGRRNLPEEYHYIIEKAEQHQAKLKRYPMDHDGYGLIHTDLHFGNMFYDGQKLTFFDFDDASYKHFISDIAIIVFYIFAFGDTPDDVVNENTIELLKPFVKGYETQNKLDKYWFEQLNEFLKLREIIVFMVMYAAGEEYRTRPFIQSYFKKYGPRIQNDVPFLNIDQVMKGIWNS